jgi:hypothetical protein
MYVWFVGVEANFSPIFLWIWTTILVNNWKAILQTVMTCFVCIRANLEACVNCHLIRELNYAQDTNLLKELIKRPPISLYLYLVMVHVRKWEWKL